jgi:hypothetical protein
MVAETLAKSGYFIQIEKAMPKDFFKTQKLMGLMRRLLLK